MVSEHIQPLNSIGPADPQKAREKEMEKDPAKKDYIEGREFYTAGNYTMAAQSFHNAMKGFEEQGNEQGVANASDRLGDVCLARDQYELAIDNFQRAYAICEKEEDSFSSLSLNKKIAIAHRELGQLDQSLEILYDMLDHYQLTRHPKGVVDILIVLAEIYVKQGKTEKAVEAYRTVSSIHGNFKHKRLSEDFARRAEELAQA
ncbi:MAG: tetratricopeptide repeat protein [Desulfobulbaceae bacterium]|nr:tetratricopeptide repeat protein [Desulfobulbaceae bacterium]